MEKEKQKRTICFPHFAVCNCKSGFTMVEMSIVLIVIGIIILIVYPAVNVIRISAQRNLTDSNLQSLMRATAVYVQANGCLPCPTPAGTVGSGFGRVRGDTGASACAGCAQPEGVAPFVSLGVPEAVARDGWNRWITMRVDPSLTVNFGVVPPTSPCTSSDVTAGICTQTGLSQKGMCRTGLSSANRITVQTPLGSSQQAAVIFVSHGANGYGAFSAGAFAGPNNGSRPKQRPIGMPTCSTNGGYEACNYDNNTVFFNAPQFSGNNDPFDDTLLFLDRNNLISMLGNGSCHTTW